MAGCPDEQTFSQPLCDDGNPAPTVQGCPDGDGGFSQPLCDDGNPAPTAGLDVQTSRHSRNPSVMMVTKHQQTAAGCPDEPTFSNPVCLEGDLVNGQCIVPLEPTPEPAPEPTPEPAPEPAPEPTPEPTPEPAPEPTPEPAPADDTPLQQMTPQLQRLLPFHLPLLLNQHQLRINLAACLGSGACQVVNRAIYQKAFLPIGPEYILQLRPELCLDVNISDIANEIQGIPGVTLIHVYDLPGYQAISFRGNPGPELLNDQRFVDHNATSVDN